MLDRGSATVVCSAERFQIMVSGKYKLRILWGLGEGPRRYGEIKRGLLTGGAGTEEIAARALSRELKQLASMGMIARRDYRLVPPKLDYALTERTAAFSRSSPRIANGASGICSPEPRRRPDVNSYGEIVPTRAAVSPFLLEREN